MDDLDLAAEREQIDRDAAIANQRAKAAVDGPALVCADCDCLPKQKVCVDYVTCLQDFDRRRSSDVRNGRSA